MGVDLIIKGGIICTGRELFKADVAIQDGKIVGIGQASYLAKGKQEIDATGKYILPGLWHTHCHFRDPGMTHKEDFQSGQRCAAAGGITFTIDQTNTDPHPSTLQGWNTRRALAKEKAILDYNHYAAAVKSETIPALAEAGAIGFKLFNTMSPKVKYPHIPELTVQNHGQMYELYEAVAKTGLPILVHHDNVDWVKWMVEREYLSKGNTKAEHMQDAYRRGIMYGHGMVMGLAVSLYIARLTGVKLFVSHVGLQNEYDMELISHARSNGQTVHTELDMIPFLVDEEKAKKFGPFAPFWGKDPQVAWKWIREGVIDVMLIEHAPHTKAEIDPGWETAWDVPPTILGAQEFLPIMLNHVNQGHLSLQDLVRLMSENPSKIFGIYPKKGAIQIGSDADFTIVDLQKEQPFTKAMIQSKSGWSIFEGDTFKGWPVRTIVRGKTVMEDGKITATPGYGEFVVGN